MAIVYRQEELIKALDEGCKEITLCAGIYAVRNASDVVFDRIGPVKVEVDYTLRQAEERGLKFIDIYPAFKAAYGIESRENMSPVTAVSSNGSYMSSYGSYVTSYGSFVSSGGSGMGTHYYEYEFENRTSWKTSATGSYAAGYSFTEEYAGSISDSFCSSFKNSFSETKPDAIRIFGYGINLI